MANPSTVASDPSVRAIDRTADFGTRFTAWMLDAAFLFGAQWVVVMVTSRQLQAAGMTSTEPCTVDSPFMCQGPSTALWVVLFLIVVLSTFGFHAWFDGALGATPGKRWMGLRVIDAAAATDDSTDDSSEPIGLARGLLRAVVRQAVWVWAFLFLAASPISVDLPATLWLVLFALSLGPLVWAAFTPRGRGWHDLVAGSVVARSVDEATS